MPKPDRSRRPGRRHGIPPAPPVRKPFAVLKDVQGPLGITLWRAVRDVRLWAETPDGERPGLFHPINDKVRMRSISAQREAPEIADALSVFAELANAPERMEAALLIEACTAVRKWAELREHFHIEMHFAETVAYAKPNDPAAAIDAGWACHRSGGEDKERGLEWLYRAFKLSVRTKSKGDSIRALTRYGALLKDFGRLDEAEVAYTKAKCRAARTGRKRDAAVAYHYLFAMAAETGKVQEAIEYADRALTLYPINDERIPYLGHDVGFLLVRQGFYRPALRLLEHVLSKLERPGELVLVFGTAAQAAAGARRMERYEALARAALELAETYEEWAAGALVGLAEGARTASEWERAERYASEALDRARQRRDVPAETAALAALTAAQGRVPTAPAADALTDARIPTLTRRLAARLLRWRRRRGRGKDAA